MSETAAVAPTVNLATAVLAVMQSCPYVMKRKVQGLNYTFAGERDLLRKLRPAMIANGLLLVPERSELVHKDPYTSSGGKPMNRVIVAVTYQLIHAPSGEARTISTVGEGSDVGDKATSKAMTSALKYALRQAFLIETGDDPDRMPSSQQERRPAQAPAQHQQPQNQPQTNGHAPQRPAQVAVPAQQGNGQQRQRDPAEIIGEPERTALTQLLFRKGMTWERAAQWLSKQEGSSFQATAKLHDLSFGYHGRLWKALEKQPDKAPQEARR